MKSLVTCELRNADSLITYADQQKIYDASIEGPTEDGWYIIWVDCTLLQYERLYGFLEGLECLQ